MKTIAVVPAYNEEKTVGGVLAEIKEACPDLDILVVDDGSADRTAEALELRGFEGRIPSLPPFRAGRGDLALGVAACAAVALAVGSRLPWGR